MPRRRPPRTGAGKTGLERKTEALRFLGLAQRAGALVTGVGAVREALRHGTAHLVLLADDAAAGQAAKVEGLLRHRETPHRVVASREELGRALGGPPLSAVAVTEGGFARRFMEKLGAPEGPGTGPERHEEDGTYAG